MLGTAVLFIALIAAFAYSKSGRKDTLRENFLHICIPFSSIPKIDPSAFAQEFTKKWKSPVSCGDAKNIDPSEKGQEHYILRNDTNNIRITVSDKPLQSKLVDLTILGNRHLTETDKTALRNNKAYISIDYLFGEDKANDRVHFTAQALLSLLEKEGSLGHVNIAAMSYTPRRESESFSKIDELKTTDLYLLFIGSHLVDEGDSLWLHTHGMGQFGTPDLQVRYKEKDKQQYYWELLSDASIYMIENGPILKPGDTAELKGDGINYEIKSGKPETENEFGPYGSLEIIRKQ
jgi:hypothetical protein